MESIRSNLDLSLIEQPETPDDISLGIISNIGTEDDVTTSDHSPQINRAAELQELWQTESGQIWQLGDHLLLIGDSTSKDDTAPLLEVMNKMPCQLCFTSPPYWVGKSYEAETSITEVRDFISRSAAIISLFITSDGGRIVLNTSTARATAIDPRVPVETIFTLAWWQDALRSHDWLMRHCRLWVKSGQLAAPSVSPNADLIDQHWETISTFLPTFYNKAGLRRGQQRVNMPWAQQGVWDDIRGESNEAVHGAAFPLELPLRYLALYSVEGESVFEPFCGTGTTLIACEMTHRQCYAIERDPSYVALTIQRWTDLTKESPRLVMSKEAVHASNSHAS